MSLLLDTCTFLWLVSEPKKLSSRAHQFLEAESSVYLSAITVYEISAKHMSGKLKLSDPPDGYVRRACELHALAPLPFTQEAAVLLPKIPRLHGDPFDRMLVCQALQGGHTIVSPDEKLAEYPVMTIW